MICEGTSAVFASLLHVCDATLDNATEDAAQALTGICVTDVDSATLTVDSGSLLATSGLGVTVVGNATGALSLTGSASNINTFIAASKVSFLGPPKPANPSP